MGAIEARIEAEEALAATKKRKSKPTDRFGKQATTEAVDVASGKRRGVPSHLALDKKQSSRTKKSVTSNRRTAELMMERNSLKLPTAGKPSDEQVCIYFCIYLFISLFQCHIDKAATVPRIRLILVRGLVAAPSA